MNTSQSVYEWQHKNSSGGIIGKIKRFIDREGKKRDIPFYKRCGNEFEVGIPEELKQKGYPLFGIETFKDAKRVLIVCEGQKSQKALAELGFQCVTSILGASNAHRSNWKEIEDADLIYFMPDNDESGEKYIQTVYKFLYNSIIAPKVKVIRLPHLPPKGDVCDWLKQQRELKSWNELDSLANHPAYKIVQGRLQHAIGANLEDIPDSWNKEIAQENSTWGEPEPIQNTLLPVESLEMQYIPKAYHDWISDIAERMQCPPDFIAVAAIVATASIIGAGCGIKPKQMDEWLVIPNLWGGIVGRPGMLKSPAVSEVMQIMNQFETESKKKFDSGLAEYNADLKIYKASKEALKSAMLNSQKKMLKNNFSNMTNDPDSLKKQFIHLQEPGKPIWKRFKTNDATVEKLSELLADNPRGLLIYRDELIGLLSAWDKEGREGDRAFFLEAWNGYGSLTTDRIGRGMVHTENLCISIFGNTQPTKLTRYLDHAIRGLDNDGLLQRFQLLIYPDEPQNWKLIDREPNYRAKQRVVKILKNLSEMDSNQCGATKETHDRFAYFRFDEESQQLFYQWLINLENKKLKADDQPIMLEHLAKYRSLMPSLALIFHLIEIADGKANNKISIPATVNAIAWCDYLESHARRIYSMATTIANQAAMKLAKKIQEGELLNCFSLRDVYRKHWSLLDDKEIIKKACVELIEANWLRQSKSATEIGKPKNNVYLINPKIQIKKNFPLNGPLA